MEKALISVLKRCCIAFVSEAIFDLVHVNIEQLITKYGFFTNFFGRGQLSGSLFVHSFGLSSICLAIIGHEYPLNERDPISFWVLLHSENIPAVESLDSIQMGSLLILSTWLLTNAYRVQSFVYIDLLSTVYSIIFESVMSALPKTSSLDPPYHSTFQIRRSHCNR